MTEFRDVYSKIRPVRLSPGSPPAVLLSPPEENDGTSSSNAEKLSRNGRFRCRLFFRLLRVDKLYITKPLHNYILHYPCREYVTLIKCIFRYDTTVS
jgi:hypothetical protein